MTQSRCGNCMYLNAPHLPWPWSMWARELHPRCIRRLRRLPARWLSSTKISRSDHHRHWIHQCMQQSLHVVCLLTLTTSLLLSLFLSTSIVRDCADTRRYKHTQRIENEDLKVDDWWIYCAGCITSWRWVWGMKCVSYHLRSMCSLRHRLNPSWTARFWIGIKCTKTADSHPTLPLFQRAPHVWHLLTVFLDSRKRVNQIRSMCTVHDFDRINECGRYLHSHLIKVIFKTARFIPHGRIT